MVWLVIGYLVCVFLCHGLTFAHFIGKDDHDALKRKELLGYSLCLSFCCAIAGPFGIAVAFLISGFAHYGFKVK